MRMSAPEMRKSKRRFDEKRRKISQYFSLDLVCRSRLPTENRGIRKEGMTRNLQ